ncbi:MULTISPECIES: hypothetical protein [unclassified Akkermansia]|jgi:hypothetical protein|uniref:hypothetical protein n=1 Tax=unclassified Akkermansia TaxID=2608915 RepID=UPI001F00A720|nr:MULTISPECIES: hypothetical protein [unclassified Akkermansia]
MEQRPIKSRNPVRWSRLASCLLSAKGKPVAWPLRRKQPVRIPDEINDKTADFFFTTELRTERGDIRILNEEIGKMTFQRPLNYRELVPGQEYHATISVCLDEVDLEDREQCSCVLETP